MDPLAVLIWKDIPGYEGLYQVSDNGTVRSCQVKRTPGKKWTKRKAGTVKRSRFDKDGYYMITLSRDGVKTTFHIHELVCFAFRGPRPKGAVVRHLDHTKTNNNVANLLWGTPKENATDRFNNPKDVRFGKQKQ